MVFRPPICIFGVSEMCFRLPICIFGASEMVFRPLIYFSKREKADFPTPNNDLVYENI